MARVRVTPAALDDLEGLIRTQSLPADTRARLRRSLQPLSEFPQMGAPLLGRWRDYRFTLGPWRWMLVVYLYEEGRDEVQVVTIQDARSSTAATGHR